MSSSASAHRLRGQETDIGEDGLSAGWIGRLFENADMLKMGHGQRAEDRNLGLGWLYYAFGRMIRTRRAVVIGSWRGFAPLMIAKALQDNIEPGEVIFIDPSLADDFWRDADRVRDHFLSLGIANIRHFRMTTQAFVDTGAYRSLGRIGLLFIDGKHTDEQASFDYGAFSHLLEPRGLVMIHDSMVMRDDKVYGSANAYRMTVKTFVDSLKTDPALQLLDLPFGSTGITLLRKLDEEATRNPHDWLDGGPRGDGT